MNIKYNNVTFRGKYAVLLKNLEDGSQVNNACLNVKRSGSSYKFIISRFIELLDLSSYPYILRSTGRNYTHFEIKKDKKKDFVNKIMSLKNKVK